MLTIQGNGLYQQFDNRPNQRVTTISSKEDNRATIDVPKFVLVLVFYFERTFYINSGIEFEEFGEYFGRSTDCRNKPKDTK